eukprot:TRINITY_DN245_c0_g1_i1.p1 TRINITY_DN245_c0_g1~~TRINITY_DN245_c0_g1_i1.p1  ORF type:complete len:759 (-),score=167.85 TRINITY_DN245_c0_g1_i1:21-2297(-)
MISEVGTKKKFISRFAWLVAGQLYIGGTKNSTFGSQRNSVGLSSAFLLFFVVVVWLFRFSAFPLFRCFAVLLFCFLIFIHHNRGKHLLFFGRRVSFIKRMSGVGRKRGRKGGFGAEDDEKSFRGIQKTKHRKHRLELVDESPHDTMSATKHAEIDAEEKKDSEEIALTRVERKDVDNDLGDARRELASLQKNINRLEREIRRANKKVKRFFKEHRASDDTEVRFWVQKVHDLHEDKLAFVEKESLKEHDLRQKEIVLLQRQCDRHSFGKSEEDGENSPSTLDSVHTVEKPAEAKDWQSIYQQMPDPSGLKNVIEFPLMNGRTKKFFCRNCYSHLYKKCMELWKPDILGNINPIILLGTPGIGKTYFIHHILSEEKKKKNRVFYQMAEDYLFLFDPNTETVTQFLGESIRRHLSSECNRDTLFVVDSYRMSEAEYSRANRVILISSPDRDVWYKFFKGNLGMHLYMPLWTEEEIKQYNHDMGFGFSDAHLRDAWNKNGGMIRYLHAPIEPPFEHSMSSVEGFLRSGIEIRGEGGEISHRLIHISVPIDEKGAYEFSKFEYVFASGYICDQINSTLARTRLNDLSMILDLCSSGYSDHAVSGIVFEHVMHRVFENGGTFKCSPLAEDENEEMVIRMKKTGPAKIFEKDGDILSVSFENKYCVPPHDSFPAIDGAYHDYDPERGGKASQVYLFQMTVRKNHPIKEMRKVLKYVRPFRSKVTEKVVRGCSLIFVVPELLKPHWKNVQTHTEGVEGDALHKIP